MKHKNIFLTLFGLIAIQKTIFASLPVPFFPEFDQTEKKDRQIERSTIPCYNKNREKICPGAPRKPPSTKEPLNQRYSLNHKNSVRRALNFETSCKNLTSKN